MNGRSGRKILWNQSPSLHKQSCCTGEAMVYHFRPVPFPATRNAGWCGKPVLAETLTCRLGSAPASPHPGPPVLRTRFHTLTGVARAPRTQHIQRTPLSPCAQTLLLLESLLLLMGPSSIQLPILRAPWLLPSCNYQNATESPTSSTSEISFSSLLFPFTSALA